MRMYEVLSQIERLSIKFRRQKRLDKIEERDSIQEKLPGIYNKDVA